MPQTPAGVAEPYLDAAGLFRFVAPEVAADSLRPAPDAPRPTRRAMEDPASVPGAILKDVLLAASGELESACRVGKRYSPADLSALTGSGLLHRNRVLAGLAAWRLQQRLKPGTADPRLVPGALEALAELDRLRDGDRVWGFEEAAAAGLPQVAPRPEPSRVSPPTPITAAGRFFGKR